MIVITDADTMSVQDRVQQLRTACAASNLTSQDGYIQQGEPIAVLIPRRNIETWLRLLDGQAVDEATDYKQGTGTGSCRTQVAALLQHCQQQIPPPNSVASLDAACAEYRRVLPLLPKP